MKIVIIGAGKMGSWLARELSKEHEIAVYDVDKAKSVENTRKITQPEELQSFNPEMLINAASLQNTVKAFEETIAFLPKDCVISDVASVKAVIAGYYKKSNFRFASMHPMFGPTFSDMSLLKKENAVVISEGDERTRGFFKDFLERLGVRVYEYSFSEHDEMMAYSLTTPFVSSLVFAACMDSNAVPGSTFAKHKEIAKGLLSEDDQLLAEVLFNPLSLPQLEKITSRLEFLKHVIKARDSDEIKRFLIKLRKNMK